MFHIFCTFICLFTIYFDIFKTSSTEIADQPVISPTGLLMVDLGSRVLVNCSIPGRNDYPHIWWQDQAPLLLTLDQMPANEKNSTSLIIPLVGDSRRTYTWIDGSVLQLVVTDFRFEDSGAYYCVSEASGVVRSASVNLEVLGLSVKQWVQNHHGAEIHGCRHFSCRSSGHCIFRRYRCDGIVNCPDASDEIGCKVGCENGYQCRVGKCIGASLVCDGFRNCDDSSDESFCHLSAWQTDNDNSDEIVEDSDESLRASTVRSIYLSHGNGGVWHFNALYSGVAAVFGLFCVIIIVVIAFCRFHRQAMGLSASSSNARQRSRCRHRWRISATDPGLDFGIGVPAVPVAPPPYCEAPPPPYSTLERPPPRHDFGLPSSGAQAVLTDAAAKTVVEVDVAELSQISERDDLLPTHQCP